MGSKRARGIAAAALLMAMTMPSTASLAVAVPSESVGASILSPASDALKASTDARSLRREVAALLQRYIDEYGDRFSETELQELRSYKANADRQLASVVVTTSRFQNLTAQGGSSAEVKSAVGRAMTAWTRAKGVAESSWEKARRIMEPKLSLFEKVGAANDYDQMMDAFDALGDRIRAVR